MELSLNSLRERFFKSKPPLIKKSELWRLFLMLFGKDVIPRFIRILHETDEVNVVHERQTYHRHDLREGTVASNAP